MWSHELVRETLVAPNNWSTGGRARNTHAMAACNAQSFLTALVNLRGPFCRSLLMEDETTRRPCLGPERVKSFKLQDVDEAESICSPSRSVG